jgi:hypothetical protein
VHISVFFLRGYIKDIFYRTLVTSLDELKLRIVAAIETYRKCWITLGGELHITWTSYMTRKADMLKLYSCLQH